MKMNDAAAVKAASNKKKIIGITGGVGAGKSTVLNILKDGYGAHLILADDVAHTLYEPGTAGYRELVKALGSDILNESGDIDRAKLSDLIFGNDDIRETVNGIIHPLTWQAICKEAEDCSAGLVAVESAVFDTAPEGFFDEIWYIYTSRENRIKRLMESRGYTREKCLDILAVQDTDEGYRNIADRIIDNNGDEVSVKDQIREILDK